GQEMAKSPISLTGKYLSGSAAIPVPKRRAVRAGAGKSAVHYLVVRGATQNNLKDLTVSIPLGRFVCVTGVSGSGKTTLIREVMLPLLQSRFKGKAAKSDSGEEPGADDSDSGSAQPGSAALGLAVLSGWESLGHVVLVDQAPLGKTPRSNPAVYIG